MRLRHSLWLAAGLLATGCVTPATLHPPATTPTTASGAALAENQGVKLVASGDAWKGSPAQLGTIVTPVEIRIENQSGRPLRIDYADFTLVGTSHFAYAALSPFQLSQEGQSAVGGSGLEDGAAAGVWVAPPMRWSRHGFGRGWGGWAGGYGPGWYDPFFAPYAWYNRPEPEPLPTRDMVRTALPTGTLESGGTLTGFLYFQNVSEREGRITLQARLVDARTGEQFGTLSIPFDVRS